MRQEMTGFGDSSGISWAICKQSAPRSKQITTQTSHHSIFAGWMLIVMPNQQWQSTEGTHNTFCHNISHICVCVCVCVCVIIILTWEISDVTLIRCTVDSSSCDTAVPLNHFTDFSWLTANNWRRSRYQQTIQRRTLQIIAGNIPYDETCCLFKLTSLSERRDSLCSKPFRQLVSQSHILHCLLPEQRDDGLTGWLRSRKKYPTVRARTNRFNITSPDINRFSKFFHRQTQW